MNLSWNHVLYAVVSAMVLSYVQHAHPDMAAAAMQFLLVFAHALHVNNGAATNGK